MPTVSTELIGFQKDIHTRLNQTRRQSEIICEPLEKEDFVAQPITDVSPPKWHLAHTTWFFENFILVPFYADYQVFHKDYSFLFNSYYVTAGARWVRSNRGNLTRPGVEQIFAYRHHVDLWMDKFLAKEQEPDVLNLFELGIQHEQQHQELLLYDIKYILGQNPLFPAYITDENHLPAEDSVQEWLHVPEGVHEIGYDGNGFHFDNEKGRHKTYLHDYEISSRLVTNGEFLEFLNDGGYEKTTLWLSDGWDWRTREEVVSPLYWVRQDGGWHNYTLRGLQLLDMNEPVSHVSFYEADAYARWKGVRLPTEFEWEVASQKFEPEAPKNGNFVEQKQFRPIGGPSSNFFGDLWEWTGSSYRPYPYYSPPIGAIGEYNGKFMSNQMVLKGGSFATPANHIRPTYRNFFHPHLQWHFNGIRLCRHT